SKETVLLYPAVLWLATRARPHGARGAVIPCAAASILFAITFWLTDPFGNLRTAPGTNSYEVHWDASVLASWATYLSWASHLVDILQADLYARVASHPEGWWVTFAWLMACALLAWQARKSNQLAAPAGAATVGAAAYAAFIAPVLPLATHAFHLYLYLPLA